MFKNKLRIIPAVLAAMALTALTACGGSDSKPADATTTAAETTTEATTEAEKEETTATAQETEACGRVYYCQHGIHATGSERSREHRCIGRKY